MKNTKVIIGILLVFALGVIVGGLTVRIVYEKRYDAILSGDLQARDTAIMNRLSKSLVLDYEQRKQILTIIQDGLQEIAGIHQRTRPEILAVLEKNRSLIRKVLRPDQVARYERIIARKQRP
jgi:hypothetical protein